jgi:hypothetical protein
MWMKEKAREWLHPGHVTTSIAGTRGFHMKATSNARHALNSSTQAGVKNVCSAKIPLSPFAH